MPGEEGEGLTYSGSGVDPQQEEASMKGLLKWIGKTFELREGVGRPKLPIGYFANVVDLGGGMGLAISADGVGTKLIVAEMLGKYDTVGIDCIAMNVNDLLCVGAEPISMVDYVAVQEAKPDLLEQLAKGLYEGARQANISIPGGEIAQVKELIKGEREGYGFDIAGMAVGLVPLDRIIVGRDLAEGDAVVGLRSSGIHSNGLTLARQVLFDKAGLSADKFRPEFGRTVGEELLEPTRIYVREVVEMLKSGLAIKAMAHITGDGFFNMTRVEAPVGLVIESLPDAPAIFAVLQQLGGISDEEMFRVYNMGVGFCVMVPESQVDRVIEIAAKHGSVGQRIGRIVADPEKKIIIEPKKLVGKNGAFAKM
jgi:phosphoribosylformylglycinamidine cyclo-ligase